MTGWVGHLPHNPRHAPNSPRDAQKIQTIAQVFVICVLLPGDRSRDRREPRREMA